MARDSLAHRIPPVRGRGRGRGEVSHGARGRAERNGGNGRGRCNAVAESVDDAGTASETGTGQTFLATGLSLAGFPEERQKVTQTKNLERFRAFYGIGPDAMSSLFNDLVENNPSRAIEKRSLFMTLNWAYLYDTEPVLAGRWKLYEDTIRSKVKDYSESILKLRSKKIKWEGFGKEEFIVSVDGTHCRIMEPRTDPGSKWYSHKFNAAAVAYELAISIRSSRLVSIRGPFPASTHDITIFRGGKKKAVKDPDALWFKIPPGKKAIGDSGYQGEPEKIAISRDVDSIDLKKFKARVKSRHETFNSRLKSFRCLELPFRHGFAAHERAFSMVCVAIQYNKENGRPLFEV